MNTTCKPSNPKDICGSSKLPLSLWPTTATALGSIALLNGALKYGRSNFRAVGVRSSIYYDAARRHLDAWFEGEECDSDDGVPHLAAVLACIAIIVDAGAAGKLTDDRMISGGYREFMDELTPHVNRLKALHASRDPKHYTIADNQAAEAERTPDPAIERVLAGRAAMEKHWKQAGHSVSALPSSTPPLPAEVCSLYGIVPLRISENSLIVGCRELPTTQEALEIRLVLNRPVVFDIMIGDAVTKLLAKYEVAVAKYYTQVADDYAAACTRRVIVAPAVGLKLASSVPIEDGTAASE